MKSPVNAISAINATEVPVHGEVSLKISLDFSQEFLFSFQLCEIPCAIIEADFLRHYSLILNLSK